MGAKLLETGFGRTASVCVRSISSPRRVAFLLLPLLSCIGTINVARAGVNAWTTHGPEGGYIRSLVQDSSNPPILYASSAGGGVFKSTDHGGSWTAINNGIIDPDMNNVAVDPSNASILYASGIADIYRSTDGGASWAPTNIGPANGGVVVVAPSSPSTLYTGGYGVWTSTDGAANWTAASGALPSGVMVESLAVDLSNASIVYAGTFDDGVLKTTDGGGSWTAVNTGLVSTYNVNVGIDPTSPSIVYAGTLWGLSESTDGGGTWTTLTATWTLPDGSPGRPPVSSFAVDPSDPSSIYIGLTWGALYKTANSGGTWTSLLWKSGTFYVNSVIVDRSDPSLVYAGMASGLLKSSDTGGTWEAAESGLTASYIRSLAVDPSNALTVYAVAQTASVYLGIFKSTDGGGSWTNIGGPRPTALAVDPSSPSTLYAGVAYSGVFKSTDAGASWTPTSSDSKFNPSCLAVAPSSPSTIYVGTNTGVVKSTDGGATWADVNSGLTTTDISRLAVHPSNASTLYVGTNGGGVFRSTDGAASWTAVNSGLSDLGIDSLALAPTSPPTLYVATYYSGAFKSTDGGATWSHLDGLSDPYPYSVAVHPADPSIVYASGATVYKSGDGGTTWTVLGNDLGSTCVNVESLVLAPSNPLTIYAGSWGAGVLELEQTCGNGTLDPGEQCDDGNTNNNDACKNDCTLNVCGDGSLNPATEQCDDGNLVDGDGCSANCQLEYIPGGPGRNDCVFEWLTTPVPARDRRGLPTGSLRCADGDPSCDFDDTDGMCTFHVKLCFNVADPRLVNPTTRLPWCTPSDVARVDLLRPRQAMPRNDVERFNRDSLENGLITLGGAVRGRCINRGPQRGQLCVANSDCDSAPSSGNGVCRGRFVAFDPPNTTAGCTDVVEIEVPRGNLTRLLVNATPSNDPVTGRRRQSDNDLLALTCSPSP